MDAEQLRLHRLATDIEERAVLCHKLLNSDVPTTSVTGSIMSLILAISHARLGGLTEQQEPSDKIIECLREANLRLPNFSAISIVLASSLHNRYCMTYSNDDYEEGTNILDKVIHAPRPEDGLCQVQPQKVALLLATSFAQARFSMFGKPEYLEEAIYRTRRALGDVSLPPATKYALAAAAAILQMRRLEDLGTGIGPQEAHPRNLGVSVHPSFEDLIASLTDTGLNADRPSHHLTASLDDLNSDNYMKHIAALSSINYITDGAELEEAIKYCRLLLASSHHDSNSTHLATIAGMALRGHLHRAFLLTNKIEYLNEAISFLRDHFNAQGVQRADSSVLFRLIESLSTRYDLLRGRADYKELMQLFSAVANTERLRTPDRFLISCSWAGLARLSGDSSTLAAYECAISLMQDTLTVAPTLDTQHSRLVSIHDGCKTLPLDYASYHFSAGQLPRAIETLERGRALIWSEMRGLRASIDEIRVIDSHLADTFASVNKELETLTFKLALSLNSNDDGQDGDFVNMGPFGRLVVKQRELLDDRNKLISQIQTLAGFETFLGSPSFDSLHSAAARGPVIIINHCRWRSDILILRHNFPPSLIPTADDFYGRAIKLRYRLLNARKKNTGDLDSAQYEDALEFVLKELYELVGQPVIQKLNELGIPEQSRVWWCPTSVFCSLPLHAMGPIPSNDGFCHPQYFLDLYIPSYTPTLSTLVESNNRGSNTLDKPSILLVSQLDETLPGARGEMKVVQAISTHVTTLISAMATPATVLEHLRDHRFVHIACHGKLEPGKPFGASFKLFGEGRLSLFDIVRSQLPEAEFAFLSACHTAELTEESIADEALHLAAAMQYCGFRSVVGTMWAVVDGDGRDLAKNFYKHVFSDRQEGERYYERTAEALRDAVMILRKRGVTLERWGLVGSWKQFGSVDHQDYYAFRSFVLDKVRNHVYIELKTLSSIMMACEVAAQSDDVPPLQNYVDIIYTFRERISPGKITWRIHLEDWHRYILVRVEEMDDTQSQMDEMFAKIRNEIGGIERRIKKFNAMVDELVRMVGAMQETERVRQAAMAGGGGLQIRADGLMNGFWIRSATSATRMPPYPARGPVCGGRRMESRQQPRTPPSAPHPAATPSPLSAADSRRLPASVSSRSRSRQARQAASSAAVISRPSSPSPPPAPPRPARNDIHLRFFHRVFHMSQNANIPASVQRRPSPERMPSPVDIQPPPPPPSPGPGFGFHESPSASLIAETRTRLPPPPEESPIPYRPLGQRMFLFSNRP